VFGLILVAACTANEGAAENAAVADVPARPANAWMGDSSVDFVRPGFAPGARLTVLYGNPADTGYFVLRLAFPDGYAVPPHWHPTTEMITVLDGTFVIGMGERADRAQARAIRVGGVGAAPAKMPHFAWADGATVVQVHGTGPFQLNLVTPTP
jgi:anti-sigma factor ChrR (cupin superfamily)